MYNMYIYHKRTHYLQFLTSLLMISMYHLLHKLNIHSSLVHTLNELLEHVFVHVYHLRGTMLIFLKSKCYCEAVIYRFLGQTKKPISNSFTFQINQPTRRNNFSSLLLDVYVQLNVFRASSRPSSGAQQLQ